MAGKKQRYKIQWVDGTIRTVTAQSFQGAKKEFQKLYCAPKGKAIIVWIQGAAHDKRSMRT
jgi:hypothetical protein